MKRCIVFLIYCVATFSKAHAQEGEALVKAVRAKLDKVQDYEAQGRMTIDVSFIQAPQSDVTVYYKKPDLFKVKKRTGFRFCPKAAWVLI